MDEKVLTNRQKAWIIFTVYTKAMLLAFTGGSVTWPILIDQFAVRYKFIDEDEMIELLGLSQALPGTPSINLGVMMGQKVAGPLGAFAAIAGSVLPAFFGMLFITIFYDFVSNISWVNGLIKGISSASVAIITFNAIIILRGAKFFWEIMVAIIAFLLTFVLKIGILPVILGCSAVRVIGMFLKDVQVNKK